MNQNFTTQHFTQNYWFTQSLLRSMSIWLIVFIFIMPIQSFALEDKAAITEDNKAELREKRNDFFQRTYVTLKQEIGNNLLKSEAFEPKQVKEWLEPTVSVEAYSMMMHYNNAQVDKLLSSNSEFNQSAMMTTWNMGTGDAANGATITECSGSFYDSGGPSGDYSIDENYSLTFTPPSGQVVVTFNSTDIEPDGPSNCYDKLEIYDGSSSAATFLGTACGSITSGVSLTSTSGSIHFVFTSDNTVVQGGFDISITNTDVNCGVPTTPTAQADYTIDNGGTINTCSGVFADAGDLGGDYGGNENHTTTFCSDNEYHVSFTFDHFNTEAGNDILNIYDGNSTGATLIGAYAGFGEANSPGVVTSTETCLTFEFISNGSVASLGWEASISCTGDAPPSAAGSWSGYPTNSACGSNTELGGIVYEDINNDGTRDSRDGPLKGVTVTLFDNNGQVGSPTTTDAAGAYSFSALTASAVYRVEFTVLDNFEEGPYGPESGTTVQFIQSGRCDANLGLIDKNHYCDQTNPFFIVPCYANGDPQDPSNVGTTGLARFEYNDRGDSPTATYTNYVDVDAVGTVWGTSYDGSTQKLYMSSMLKRHAGLGPDGIGAVYVHQDGDAADAASVFYDFGNDAGIVADNATRFPGSGDAFGEVGPCGPCDNIDPTTFEQIGKVGFGDTEVDPELNKLYVTNLHDRKIYSIDLDNPTPGSATPLPGIPWLSNAPCSNGIARPWALEFRRGKLYAGVICDASLSSCSIGSACSDLTANIYSFDGATWTNELSFSLDYYRQAWAPGSDYFVKWIDNWNTMKPYVANVTDGNFGQPFVADIEFDDDNSIIIGIGDRTGYQLGYMAPPPTGPSGSTAERNFVYGDILRAAYDNNTDTYILENNGSVGSLNSTNPKGNSGPGGKSFYWGDFWAGTQNQASLGGLAILPGSGEIMFPLADAVSYYANGMAWASNTNGSQIKALEVYQGIPDGSAPNFSKSGGLGDPELICAPPPIEIGNIVWWDDNLNGLQDPNELGVSNVTLELWVDPNGNTQGNNAFDGDEIKVASTTTDNYGRYIFSFDNASNGLNAQDWSFTSNDRVLSNTFYQIRIPSWATDAGLITQRNTLGYTNHLLSPTQNQGTGGNIRDNNAYDNPGNAAGAIVTGGYGDNDHSMDFAFGGEGGCEPPEVIPTANTPCKGETLNLAAAVTGGIAPYTYNWSGPNSFASTDQNPTVPNVDKILSTGIYSLTVTDDGGCIDTTHIHIVINGFDIALTPTDASC